MNAALTQVSLAIKSRYAANPPPVLQLALAEEARTHERKGGILAPPLFYQKHLACSSEAFLNSNTSPSAAGIVIIPLAIEIGCGRLIVAIIPRLQ